jgi:hypothetical protein
MGSSGKVEDSESPRRSRGRRQDRILNTGRRPEMKNGHPEQTNNCHPEQTNDCHPERSEGSWFLPAPPSRALRAHTKIPRYARDDKVSMTKCP